MFRKILIANRGEIAVRVIRACRELGISPVAVYSDADQFSLHVRMADECYYLGPPPSGESYLVQDKLLEAAGKAGAEAIHPGYGFLAENAEFARRVTESGLVFIGPPPSAIELMGDKTVARSRMLQAQVPVVPGTEQAVPDEIAAEQVSAELGFPVLFKAAAGGGGKGMRVVHEAAEIASAFRAAKSEAVSAFGDGRIYVEKYLEAPRHIEFQILADCHGHVVHFGERECSIQRRHQKVVEEAPSTCLDEALRLRMGQAAVKAAQACGYQNAGTIEFMVDKDRKFYFLEMNTRLQVEHPVTEMATGVDLVKAQIRIAAGEPLRLDQEAIRFNGHAIECRIYAEDPFNNFLPSTGTITYMMPPYGPGVRVESGFYAGSEVSVYYDPLISKLITWGRDRQEAIARMKRSLEEYQILGVETSIPFCLMVMNNERFISGSFDTHFVDTEFSVEQNSGAVDADGLQAETAVLGAALFEFQFNKKRQPTITAESNGQSSPWKIAGRRYNLRD
ncbi:MAG: acetyl-CoA carboxylase biotin carboxylase subunit [bacterium]